MMTITGPSSSHSGLTRRRQRLGAKPSILCRWRPRPRVRLARSTLLGEDLGEIVAQLNVFGVVDDELRCDEQWLYALGIELLQLSRGPRAGKRVQIAVAGVVQHLLPLLAHHQADVQLGQIGVSRRARY